MKNKKPPFEITNAMIDYVAEIAELMGQSSADTPLSANPTATGEWDGFGIPCFSPDGILPLRGSPWNP